MLYNELRAALKPFRDAGLTDISFNSPKVELQAEYDRLTTAESTESKTTVLKPVEEFATEMDEYFEDVVIVAPATNINHLPTLILREITETVGELLQGAILAIIVYGQMCQWIWRTTCKGIALGRTWYPIVQSTCKLYGLRVAAWYIALGIEAYESGQAYRDWLLYYKRLAKNG